MDKFITLIMYFWDDGQENSDRVRNVNFSWSKLKILENFLKEKGVSVDSKLYDFSQEKKHQDSVHIPFDDIVYQRSKKLNIILDKNRDSEYLMIVDCDVFFDKEDFDELLKIILGLQENIIHTFDLAKLNESDTNLVIEDKIENLKELDCWFAYSGKKIKGPLCESSGGLGGVFIINNNLLYNHGKFDEKFETWGGEDGKVLSDIMSSKYGVSISPTRNFYPYHLYNFSDWGNKKYYNNNNG